MPPKRSFTKEAILKAAMEVIRKYGFPELSARTIAKELKSSTMPVYSYLASMEEITGELRNMALDCLTGYQLKSYSDNKLLNLAIGYVHFAREEKNLFRFIFVESPVKVDLEDLDAHQILRDIPDGIIRNISRKSWIFTHGLALMVNSGMIDIDGKAIREMLEDNSAALYLWEMKKSGGGNL